MDNSSKRQGLLIAYLIIFLSVMICTNSLVFGQDIPTETYDREVFISVDYEFNNEFLYKPYQIRVIPATKEIVVLDIGNVCFFVFTDEGKFIRKIGRKGQGPGDMLEPTYFDVDNEGNIYVYEDGNSRISIFDKHGKFYNSFRIDRTQEPNLYVDQDGEIVISIPRSGYYICVFSKNGDLIKNIGKIPDFASNPRISTSSSGFSFKDENGNYIIFLESLYAVKIFNESGILIREKRLDNIFFHLSGSKEESEKSLARRGRKLGYGITINMFWDVIYRDNKFYILSLTDIKGERPNPRYLPVFVLNKDLEVERKIIMPFEISLDYRMTPGEIYRGRFQLTIELMPHTEDILFPIGERSEIYLFTQRKNK